MTEIPIRDPKTAQEVIDSFVAEKRRLRQRRAITAIILMLTGALMLAVGVSFMLETIWAGVTILGVVAVLIGILLGRES